MNGPFYMEFDLINGKMIPADSEIWDKQKKDNEGKKLMAVFEPLSMANSKGQRGTYRWWRDIICHEKKIFPHEYDKLMAETFFGYKEFDVNLPNGSVEVHKVARNYKELSFDELKDGLTKIFIHWSEQGYTLPVPDPAKSKMKNKDASR